MRDARGCSRLAAQIHSPSQRAIVGAVTDGQANSSDADSGISMQTQCLMATWGEFSAAPNEGEVRAAPPANWCFSDALVTSCVVLALFAEILTEDVIYFRRRTTIRSLSYLGDVPVHGQAIRISDAQIAKLQQILKQQFGLDYSAEEAQDAGRAILRFVGLKLYQQLEKDRSRDMRAERR